MANLKGCFLHLNDNWSTPFEYYDFYVNHLGYFDPCPLNAKFDGLKRSWHKCNFVNPPYSDIKSWVDKAIIELNRGSDLVVFLVPARTDTKWFRKLFPYITNIAFITGRLKFGNAKTGAPFPSLLIYCKSNYNKSIIGNLLDLDSNIAI